MITEQEKVAYLQRLAKNEIELKTDFEKKLKASIEENIKFIEKLKIEKTKLEGEFYKRHGAIDFAIQCLIDYEEERREEKAKGELAVIRKEQVTGVKPKGKG